MNECLDGNESADSHVRSCTSGHQANSSSHDCQSQVHHNASSAAAGEPAHEETPSRTKVLQNTQKDEADSGQRVKPNPDVINLDDVVVLDDVIVLDDDVDGEEEENNEHVYDGDWLLKGPAPGGPSVPDHLIPSFGGHVAFSIWNGKERGILKGHNFTKTLGQWPYKSLLNQRARQILRNSGLQHIRHATFHQNNMPLLSAFVERWQPDTNTFHMAFGEMTITLHDVWHILKVPIQGSAIVGSPSLSHVLDKVATLFGFSDRNDVCVEKCYQSDCIYFNSVKVHCGNDARSGEQQAVGYLLYMLGASLFSEKDPDLLNVLISWPLREIDKVKNYAWGTAALAWLYRQLGIASRATSFEISGCLTLLECWIYEYFPFFRRDVVEGYQRNQALVFQWNKTNAYVPDDRLLCKYRSQLDELTANDVNWLPYGQKPWDVQQKRSLFHGTINFMDIVEPYMPVRVIRQFGFVQDIPAPPILPLQMNRSARWQSYAAEYASIPEIWNTPGAGLIDLDLYRKCKSKPWKTASAYMDWYPPHTHLRTCRETEGEDTEKTQTGREKASSEGIILSDQAITRSIETILNEIAPGQFSSLNGFVLHFGAKHGQDLSHKAAFIADQLNILCNSPDSMAACILDNINLRYKYPPHHHPRRLTPPITFSKDSQRTPHPSQQYINASHKQFPSHSTPNPNHLPGYTKMHPLQSQTIPVQLQQPSRPSLNPPTTSNPQPQMIPVRLQQHSRPPLNLSTAKSPSQTVPLHLQQHPRPSLNHYTTVHPRPPQTDNVHLQKHPRPSLNLPTEPTTAQPQPQDVPLHLQPQRMPSLSQFTTARPQPQMIPVQPQQNPGSSLDPHTNRQLRSQAVPVKPQFQPRPSLIPHTTRNLQSQMVPAQVEQQPRPSLNPQTTRQLQSQTVPVQLQQQPRPSPYRPIDTQSQPVKTASSGKMLNGNGTIRKVDPGGWFRVCKISPELQAVLGVDSLPINEAYKQLWAYIKKHDLRVPNNKRVIVCDEALRAVFQTDSVHCFQLCELLAKHMYYVGYSKESSSSKRLQVEVELTSSQKLTSPETNAKSLVPVRSSKMIMSDKLAMFLGSTRKEMHCLEARRCVFEYIKVNNLEEPDSMMVSCDPKLRELFGCESIHVKDAINILVTDHFVNSS